MKLMALIYFVASLFGCDIGSNTYVTHTSVDGSDTLYSRATTQAGVARFECLRSISGECHYTVLPRGCPPESGSTDPQSNRCGSQPLERFVVAKGESRQITGLQDFRLCVSAGDDAADPGCELPVALVKQ